MGIQYRVWQTAVALLVALGCVALGGTWAWAQQEESEPTAEQSGNCPGAEELGTIGPDDRDLLVPPFDVDGDKFRLTYKTTDLDENGVPFLDVTVLDKNDDEVGGTVIRDGGTETEIITDSPGQFSMEIRAQDLTYEITVDDCTGSNGSSGNNGGHNKGHNGSHNRGHNRGHNRHHHRHHNGSSGNNGSAARSQYGGGVNTNNGQGLGQNLDFADDPGPGAGIPNNVIADTIPENKPLASTGGPPLVGLVFIGLACAGLGLTVLRSAIRRD
jgi:hypothetical protein